MYNLLVKAFNYALDRLSKVDVDGLPEFKEERQIIFTCSDTKTIGPETYRQGLYKPDIILIKWSKFKTEYKPENDFYSESYILDIRKRGTSLFSYCAYPGLFYLIFDGSPPFGPLKIDGFGPTLYNVNIMTNNRQKPRISQEN